MGTNSGTFILEVCADSVESVLAAERGGADRIELCGNIVIGGTTPSFSLFEEVKKHSGLKIHVLIRPRFGDFCYSDYEFSVMRSEIRQFSWLGADGISVGVLKPDGTLDVGRMRLLCEDAGKMSVTLHRAFDVCADPSAALEQAVELGIDRILSSGQKSSCTEGAGLLASLVKQGNGRIRFLAGAGVRADNIPGLYAETRITEYHMTGKILLKSPMQFCRAGVNMGLPSLSEYTLIRTDEIQIRQARAALDSLKIQTGGSYVSGTKQDEN